jgi:siroheme synthase
VRLKGGDPFIFGRGMEEVRAAEDAGIAVEVVPGVSSALAAPALGGIAVTERHVSAQVSVVAGHRVDGTNDWTQLARLDGTLVVLMAATTASRIAATLINRGAPPDRPVAVVADASGAGQAVWHTTLAGLAAHDAALPGPSVVVVGEVARARPAVADQVSQLVELLRRDPVDVGVS